MEFVSSDTNVGIDFQAIAENYKPIWDILLLDIEMPLLDGMSAAQKIREQDATVVMIFITLMAKYAIKGYHFLPSLLLQIAIHLL